MFFLTLFGAIGKFFAAVLSWLSKNPAIMITLCVIVAFVMLIVAKNHELSAEREQLTAMTASRDRTVLALGQERANTASLKGGLDDANNALGLLQTKANDAQTAYSKIIAGQAAANTRLDGKLANITNAKPGADKCASALALIKGAVN
jgi:hypothetical protein